MVFTKEETKLFDRRSSLKLLALSGIGIAGLSLLPQEAYAAGNKNIPAQVNELLGYINNFRTNKGLKKVQINVNISKVSLDWSAYMADKNYFEHNPNYHKDSRVDQGWRKAGEIIAYNGGSVVGLFNQWVNSPGHNKIMSDGDYNIVGIGLATNSNGRLYGTVNFFRYDKTIAGTYNQYPTPGNKQTFTDVNSKTIFYKEIEQIAALGITQGWTMSNGTKQYRPLENVLRDAMIVFIYRAMGSPAYTPPKKSPFIDVKTNNIFYKEIAWAYHTGITEGWKMKDGTRQFRPLEPVKRDAVAAFLMRASGDKAPAFKQVFQDVKSNQPHANAIVWMKNTGISNGWANGKNLPNYQPMSNTKRDAMAAFIVRWMDYVK